MSSHQVTTGGQSGPSVRRLRFEDETEKEAESRYQDRWRAGGGARRGGPTAFNVLPSKPRLRLSAKDIGAGPRLDGQQRGGTGNRFSLNLPHPPHVGEQRQSFTRPRPCGLSEPIRETYIGNVTHCETSRGLHHHWTLAQPPTTFDLPINPYASDGPVTVVGQPWLAPPPSGRRSLAANQESRPLVAAVRTADKQSSWSPTPGGSREHLHHFFIITPLHPLTSYSL